MKKILLLIMTLILSLNITYWSEGFSIPMIIFWDINNSWNKNLIWDTLKIFNWNWILIKNKILKSSNTYWTNRAFDNVNKISLDKYDWLLKFEIISSTNTYKMDTVILDSKYLCETQLIFQSNKICKYNISFNINTISNSWGWSWGWNSNNINSLWNSWLSTKKSVIKSIDKKWYIKPKVKFLTPKYKKINKKLDKALVWIWNNIERFSRFNKKQLKTYLEFKNLSKNLTNKLKELEDAQTNNDKEKIKIIILNLKEWAKKLKTILAESKKNIIFEKKILKGKSVNLIKAKNKITKKFISKIDKIIWKKVKPEKFNESIQYRNELNLIIDNYMETKDKEERKFIKKDLLKVFKYFKNTLNNN